MIGFSAAVDAGRGDADTPASGNGEGPEAAALDAAVACGETAADGEGEGEGLADGEGLGEGDAVTDGVGFGDGGAVGSSVTTGCGPVGCGTGVTSGAEVAPSSGSVPRF
jgi:hypothetical protein